MAQSLSKILLHVVFSTKYRQDSIPPAHLAGVHRFIATICRRSKSECFRVGGTLNHVHVACSLPRVTPPSELVREMKQYSSRWLKEVDPASHAFAWQDGYGVFSLGQSQLESLCRYIDTQAEHHNLHSFNDEFLQLLAHYQVRFNEQYLWDA